MTRLFIVSVAPGYGGAERSVEIIARHLPAHIEARIYASNSEHLARLRASAEGRQNLRIVALPRSENVHVRRIKAIRLARDFSRFEPEAVLANTHGSALLCAMAVRAVPAMAAKTSLYVRDFYWGNLDYIFSRLGQRNVLVPDAAVTDRVGYLAPLYRSGVGSDVTVVPDMVELADPAVSYNGPMLHLATINAWKGHAHLMLAASHLRKSGRTIEISTAGHASDPALHASLLQLHDRLGLERHFRFADYASDPSELLRYARGVVVSSVAHSGGPETFGRSIIEAWAHRKPVVAFATGAPANLITHEVDGLLVPPENIEALAEAMHRLWSDETLSRRLGEAGRLKVEQSYSAAPVTRRLLTALDLP